MLLFSALHSLKNNLKMKKNIFKCLSFLLLKIPHIEKREGNPFVHMTFLRFLSSIVCRIVKWFSRLGWLHELNIILTIIL